MTRSRLHQRLIDQFVQDSRRLLATQAPAPMTWSQAIDEIVRLKNKTAKPAEAHENNYKTQH
jgi:hypothetical protein